MITEPIHVSDGNFEKTVLQSTLPVIVDFWAPWCGPCKRVAPILDKIAKDYAGKVLVAKVNTDENDCFGLVCRASPPCCRRQRQVLHSQVGAL